jgi:hypothetical protein
VKLATMLCLAASLDRGRAQTVGRVGVELSGGRLRLQVQAKGNCELELWAASRQVALLERVFGRTLEIAGLPQGRVVTSPR